MDDLEITKRCAEAMGYAYFLMPHHLLDDHAVYLGGHEGNLTHYDPLHDDAQAMALVKKFGLALYYRTKVVTEPRWEVCDGDGHSMAFSADLNRAVCERVAKMTRPTGARR